MLGRFQITGSCLVAVGNSGNNRRVKFDESVVVGSSRVSAEAERGWRIVLVRVRWGVGSGPDLGMRDDKDSDVEQVLLL